MRRAVTRRAAGTALAVLMGGVAVVPAAASAATAPTAPPGYQIVESATFTVPPGQLGAPGRVKCPQGTVPWGGGFGDTGNSRAGQDIATSGPIFGGWQGQFNNLSTVTSDPVRADAICAAPPRHYVAVFTPAINRAGSQSAATAMCPDGTRVLSGGTFSTGAHAGVHLLSAWPPDTRSFESIVFNASARNQLLTTFAICGAPPAGYVVSSVISTASVNGPSVNPGSVKCPAGTSVTGGGIQIAHPGPAVTIGVSLDVTSQVWGTTAISSATPPLTATRYAICAA